MRLGLSASRPVTAPVVPRHLSASAHSMLLVHTPLLQRRAATPATWGVAMEVPDLCGSNSSTTTRASGRAGP